MHLIADAGMGAYLQFLFAIAVVSILGIVLIGWAIFRLVKPPEPSQMRAARSAPVERFLAGGDLPERHN